MKRKLLLQFCIACIFTSLNAQQKKFLYVSPETSYLTKDCNNSGRGVRFVVKTYKFYNASGSGSKPDVKADVYLFSRCTQGFAEDTIAYKIYETLNVDGDYWPPTIQEITKECPNFLLGTNGTELTIKSTTLIWVGKC